MPVRRYMLRGSGHTFVLKPRMLNSASLKASRFRSENWNKSVKSVKVDGCFFICPCVYNVSFFHPQLCSNINNCVMFENMELEVYHS